MNLGLVLAQDFGCRKVLLARTEMDGFVSPGVQVTPEQWQWHFDGSAGDS
jgi:hypothetical protein